MERERRHFGAFQGAGGGSMQDGCGLHGASLPTAASPLLSLLKLFRGITTSCFYRAREMRFGVSFCSALALPGEKPSLFP